MIADRPTVSENLTIPTLDAESNRESVVQKGKEIYEQVRAQFDTPENQHKCLIVHVDTGDCELVEMSDIARRLFELGPSTRRYLIRIGHPTFIRYRSPRVRKTKP